jgi:hypothetical protein
MPKPPDTHHFLRRAARRARRKWMASRYGRDAYVHKMKRGPYRYRVSYIDYPGPAEPAEPVSIS